MTKKKDLTLGVNKLPARMRERYIRKQGGGQMQKQIRYVIDKDGNEMPIDLLAHRAARRIRNRAQRKARRVMRLHRK